MFLPINKRKKENAKYFEANNQHNGNSFKHIYHNIMHYPYISTILILKN